MLEFVFIVAYGSEAYLTPRSQDLRDKLTVIQQLRKTYSPALYKYIWKTKCISLPYPSHYEPLTLLKQQSIRILCGFKISYLSYHDNKIHNID